MLELDFTQTLGSHCLQIRETLPASGITAVFGVSGAGKTSLINAISGLTRPQAGRIVLNGRVLNDTAQRICWRRSSAVSAMSFRMRACFPIIKCAAICSMGWRNPWSASSISWWICWGLRPCWIVCRAGYPAAKSSSGYRPRPADRARATAAG